MQAVPPPVDVRRRILHRTAVGSVVGVLVLAALLSGLALRRTLWEETATIRFRWDVSNAFKWSNRVCDESAAAAAADPSLGAPLGWRAFVRGFVNTYDNLVEQSPTGNYELDYGPLRLLTVSLWMRHNRLEGRTDTRWPPDYEFTAPLLRFNSVMEIVSCLLMFFLVRFWLRPSADPAGRKPVILATLAALLMWFDPALLLNAHVWPQWDVWLLPFYLGAAMAASKNWWMVAGACVGVGAMFKGQILIVSPVLILWPLFRGQWLAPLKLVGGFLIAVAVIASPWLAHGSMSWYKVGFAYGTRHFLTLYMGPTSNLAAVLADNFGWRLNDTVGPITIKTFLVILYGIGVVLSALAVAIQSRRNSPRVLVALVTPWLLMFTLMPQIHERYLIWAALLSCMCVGVSVGMTLMHFFLTAQSAFMMLDSLLSIDQQLAPGWWAFIRGSHPGIGYAVMVVAAVFLHTSLTRGRDEPAGFCKTAPPP